MNKLWFLITGMVFAGILFSCKEGERIVERPAFGVRNSSTLEIDKIVLNDTATIVYVDAFFRPKYWIRMDSGTYIQAGGQKLLVTGTEGIKLSDYHWMPESGKSSFVLFFPPIDRSIERIDLIESDCEDCFKIWDIELKPNLPKLSQNLPEELKNQSFPAADKLADPEMKVGRTKINVHLLGYRKEMGKQSISFYQNELLRGTQFEYEGKMDENGVYRFEFDQYGTCPGFMSSNLFHIEFVVAPGEEMDIYVDLQECARRYSVYQREKGVEQPKAYVTGKYAALNNRILNNEKHFNLRSSRFSKDINGMDVDEYTSYLMKNYQMQIDSIQNNKFSGDLNDYLLLNLKGEVLRGLDMANYFLESAYREANNIGREVRETDFKGIELNEKHWGIFKELELNDEIVYYSSSDLDYIFGAVESVENLQKILGTDQGVLIDLMKVKNLSYQIEDMIPISEKQKQMLDSIENPFYKEAFEHIEQQMQAKLEENKLKTDYKICEIPVVSDEKLFDALMASYKGKVVFVDFWATWCGPCRSAMKQAESVKEELKGKEVAYVYLTDDTSPKGTWMNMIPAIPGDHYRMNGKQWEYLSKKFKVDGIPSYLIVDKQGKQVHFQTGFMGAAKMKSMLLKELDK